MLNNGVLNNQPPPGWGGRCAPTKALPQGCAGDGGGHACPSCIRSRRGARCSFTLSAPLSPVGKSPKSCPKCVGHPAPGAALLSQAVTDSRESYLVYELVWLCPQAVSHGGTPQARGWAPKGAQGSSLPGVGQIQGGGWQNHKGRQTGLTCDSGSVGDMLCSLLSLPSRASRWCEGTQVSHFFISQLVPPPWSSLPHSTVSC